MSQKNLLWRTGLDIVASSISVEKFRQDLPWLRAECENDPVEVGLYYLALLTEWFISSAGMFAVIEAPPEEIPAALAEIRSTLSSLDFEKELKRCKRNEKRYYAEFARHARASLPLLGAAMEALWNQYASGNYDPAQNPNDLILEALNSAEEDLKRAQELISQGGAIALHGQPEHPLWWRWQKEAFGPARDWLFVTTNLVRSYTGDGESSFGPFAQFRAHHLTGEEIEGEEEATEIAAEMRPDDEEEGLIKELVDQLIEQGAAGVTPEQREFCQTNRDDVIPALIQLATDESLQMEDSPGDGFAPISAVNLLGELRAEEAVTDLIDIVADNEPGVIIADAALAALGQIGRPALEPLIEFLRYSWDVETKIALVEPLTQIAPKEDERIYPILVKIWEDASWEEGKCLLAHPLAEFGGPQAIPLLQQGLEDPDIDSLLDYNEVAIALRELGIEPPPPSEGLSALDYDFDDLGEDNDLFQLMLEDADQLLYLVERFPEGYEPSAEEIAQVFSLIEQDRLNTLIAMQSIALPEEISLPLLDRLLAAFDDLQFDADLDGYPETVKNAYGHLADYAESTLRQRINGVISAIRYYLTQRYDIADNPDQLLAAARALCTSEETGADESVKEANEQWQDLFGRAGALILHGRSFWSRWPLETDWPLSEWLNGLIQFYKPLKSIGYIPLRTASQTRARHTDAEMAELSRTLMTAMLEGTPEEDAPPAISRLIDQLITHGRGEMSAAERRPFIHQRVAVTPYLIRMIENKEYWYEEGPGEGWAAILAIQLLGEMQASQAAESLVNVVADSLPEDIIHTAAIFSLIAIGRPALPAVQAYFRYGRDVQTKTALSEVLGRIGQRVPESFDLLRQAWESAAWTDNRRMVALAFGDLRDRRAVPLLRAALQDTQADALDIDYVRWALQQLGVPTSSPVAEESSKLKTPAPFKTRLIYDEDGAPIRIHYSPWGEPLCPDCGKPLVVKEDGSWTHPERTPARTPAPDHKKRKRKKHRR